MSDVTMLINAAAAGDAKAAEDLLPIVYQELRRLARARLANERPGQTLQATALVHEAYIRLIGKENLDWNSSRHFFSAAAEAMRRILIERARQRNTERHGGGRVRVELENHLLHISRDEKLVQLDDALDTLEAAHQRRAQVVKLRFFAGLTNREAAEALGISEATADRDWLFARAWLYKELQIQ